MKLDKIIQWIRTGLLDNKDCLPEIKPERICQLIKNYEDILERTKHYQVRKFGNLVSLLLGVQRKFPDQRIWIYDRYGESIMCGGRNIMGINDFARLMRKKVSTAYDALAGECDAQMELVRKIERKIGK